MSKSIKFKNDIYLDSSSIVYKNKKLDGFIFEDVTNKFNFTKCTLDNGRIYRFLNFVYMSIRVTPTTTSGWTTFITSSEDMYPEMIYDTGSPIIGSQYWIYSSGRGIQGNIEKDTPITICGIYKLAK